MARQATRVTRAAAAAGDLPPVCVVTGQPAGRFINMTFTWVPGWTWLLLPFGIIPCLIARSFTSQKIRAVLPITAAVRADYRRRQQAVIVAIATGIGLLMVGGAIQTPAVAWVGAAVLVWAGAALVVLTYWFVSVEPARDPDWLVIRRAHRGFAAALQPSGQG